MIAEAQTLTDTLNGEDEATAVATNSEGVTLEVTYYANKLSGDPFWIYQEAGLVVVTPEDVHVTFDYEDLCEDVLFATYDLDANAAIWTRKQPEAIAQ